MFKQILYLGFVSLGLTFISGDNAETPPQTKGIRLEETIRNRKPLVQKGSIFVPIKIDAFQRVGIYRGPDNYYYKVRLGYDRSIYIEDVYEDETYVRSKRFSASIFDL
jgi:hypothetical protein